MAQPTTLNGSKLSIWLESDDSPTQFIAPCGLNTRGINFSASSNDITVPDCDDPDAPAWTQRVVASLSAGVSGSGVLAMEALAYWREFWMGGVAKNCRVVLDHADSPSLGGRFDGSFICNTFNITGEIGNKVQVEIALASDGEVTWPAA